MKRVKFSTQPQTLDSNFSTGVETFTAELNFVVIVRVSVWPKRALPLSHLQMARLDSTVDGVLSKS